MTAEKSGPTELVSRESNMSRIKVDSETAEAIRSSQEVVSLEDESGECLGYVTPPLSDEEQTAIRRRLASDGP